MKQPGTATAQPQPSEQPERLIDLREVRARVPVARPTLWRWSKAGRFPAPVRVGARTFWREAALNSWIRERAEAGR